MISISATVMVARLVVQLKLLLKSNHLSTKVNTMTQEQELAMFEELMTNYIEMYHEDEDFDPAPYETFLEECSDDEFNTEYERVFGDY
jgi:hypothetical protein